tara:strand:- start:2267 stop:3163 length:897 start_codon:yes stop_codon:yes gene_type:complete
MSVSHKYKTFDQLLNDVTIDFSSQALEGMIEPQQLIKVAQRVNYDLGIRIHREREQVLDVEHSKASLPTDFKYLNYGFVCSNWKINNTPPSGTTIDTTQTKYVPSPDDTGPCEDPTCKDVCVVKTCEDTNQESQYMVIQHIGANQWRTFSEFFPLRISKSSKVLCDDDCPNINVQAVDVAEIKDGYLLTNFKTGKVYISYQADLEDDEGNLLVLDHPYCNEYYEYALKQRILENMVFDGQPVGKQMQLIETRLRAARNNALSFVNTPNYEEMKKIWKVNRRAQYSNYYDMFKSHPTRH